MKTSLLRTMRFALIAGIAALALGCNDDKISPEQKQASAKATAQDNAQMISATQEMMDVTAGAFAEKGITAGRTITAGRESNWGCRPSVSATFQLDNTFADSLIYSGTITLDYGTGETCPDSLHRRSGKITDKFIYAISLKHRWAFSSTESILFEGFHKDSIQLDGTVVLKSASHVPTTVEAMDTKITYADGTFATWTGTLSFEYENITQCRDWGGSTITVTGSLSGTSRAKAEFTASITKGIVFKNTCSEHRFIPVTGTVEVTIAGASSTIDYGDGTCDRTYTITSGGSTTVHMWDKASL